MFITKQLCGFIIFLTLAYPIMMLTAEEHGFEAENKKHFVLQITGETVYVNYGSQDGVAPGMEVTILGRVSFQHPATGEKNEGVIPISAGKIIYVTETFSAVECESKSLPRIQVGDEVVLSVLYQLQQRTGGLTAAPIETKPATPKPAAAASPQQSVLHQAVPFAELGQAVHYSIMATAK